MNLPVKEIMNLCKIGASFGYNKEGLEKFIKGNDKYSSIDSVVISDIVEDFINDFPNFGLMQKINRSLIIKDVSGDSNSLILVDNEFRERTEVSSSVLSLMNKKYDYSGRYYICKYDYLPTFTGVLKKSDSGLYLYNTYDPPFWQQDWFYSGGKIDVPKLDKIPKIYEEFLMHLVNNDLKSYNYILNWMANAIKSRNYCILTTIGAQGIGKGVLGNIMKNIFGDSNFYQGRDQMFKSHFNSQIEGRRLVYCDEIFIKSKEEEDRLKAVVNDFIEIEAKGQNAKLLRNNASFYVSSNNLDSIKITADDRRFSIVNLTDEKLIKKYNSDDIIKLLKNDNIEKLAQYLWHLKFDKEEMLKVFKSERTEDVRMSGLKDWEEYFIFEYCSANEGEEKTLADVGDHIKEKFGWKIGRKKFQDLQNIYPEKFKALPVREDSGKLYWKIRILKEGE